MDFFIDNISIDFNGNSFYYETVLTLNEHQRINNKISILMFLNFF
jgi:hypothetical protein